MTLTTTRPQITINDWDADTFALQPLILEMISAHRRNWNCAVDFPTSCLNASTFTQPLHITNWKRAHKRTVSRTSGQIDWVGFNIPLTSGQSNLTTGRIVAAHWPFSGIHQVAPVCTLPNTCFLGLTGVQIGRFCSAHYCDRLRFYVSLDTK